MGSELVSLFGRRNRGCEGKSRPGFADLGLINDHGIGQSEFLWYIRDHRNIKKVFSSTYLEFEAGCYRNCHLNLKWKTKSGWYHCDQVNIENYFLHSMNFFFHRIHFENQIDVQN